MNPLLLALEAGSPEAGGPEVGYGLLIIAALGAVAFIVGRITRQWISEVIVFLGIGIVLGPTVLGENALINADRLQSLEPITALALGAIVFGIGERLELPKLAEMRHTLTPIAILENVLTFALAFFGMLLVGLSAPVAYLLAAIALSTSPLTLVAVANERRAGGTFTDHLQSATALNNVSSALLFGIGLPIVLAGDGGTSQGLVAFAQLVVLGPLIGIAGGWILRRFSGGIEHAGERLLFVLIVLLGLVAVGRAVGAPVVIVTLIAGAFYANDTSDTTPVFSVLRTLDAPIFLVFFVVAGAQVHFDELITIGGFGLAYVAARTIGKIAGSWLGAHATRSGRRSGWSYHFGFGLMPFAGTAIGLAAFTVEKAADAGVPELGAQVSAITLGAVVVFEILGPLTVGRALDQMGDTGQAVSESHNLEALIEPHRIRHILFPISSAEMARQKAPVVLDLAASCGATVTALHVVTPSRYDPGIADPAVSVIRQLAQARNVTCEAIAKAAEDVVGTMVEVAHDGAVDLIVIGETPPRLLDRGGQKMAHDLAERAGCYVLVIPTFAPSEAPKVTFAAPTTAPTSTSPAAATSIELDSAEEGSDGLVEGADTDDLERR